MKNALATPTNAIAPNPIIAPPSTRDTAPFLVVAPVFDDPLAVDPPLPPLPLLPLAGVALGVNVAEGLGIQELAAAPAADVDVDAWGLTVPLPAKLQDWGLRSLSSKNWLIT